jgi:ABC-type phosphate transport system substrate-binding protein
MKLLIKRAVSATIPLALLAGSTFGAAAAQFNLQRSFEPLGIRINATGPAVLGGGATLPVPAYLGKSAGGKYEGSGTTSFGVAGSIFGYFASHTGGLNVAYCATGSGKGKGVFDGVPNTVDIACANAANPTATTYGFLPPSGSPTQTYPTLAGTDAPLAQADYSAYLADHPSPMEPVELPSVFGSIAIYYNDPTLPSSITRISLTDAQICAVYTGAITKFSQITGNSADTTVIHPVYRLDGSGTSFNFSNHLATVCGKPFNGNQTFYPSADPSLPTGTAVGGTGNGGVIAAVQATVGGFGYAEAGYLAAVTLTHAVDYANVKNGRSGGVYDPILGLPAAANTVAASSLKTNVQVVQGSGPATTSALTGVRSGSCVKVIPPSAYANPSTGYPIVAVTYLLINSAKNGSQLTTALRLLEKDLTTPTLFKHPGATTPITTVDEAEPAVTSGTTGYSSLGSTFSSTIQGTANACINV